MDQNKKRKIVKKAVFLTSIFVIFMSVTYALMLVTLKGTKEVVIDAGILDLVLEEENAITISDALPMYDEVGMVQEDVFVFRLVNKTSNPTNYILKLQEIETGTLDKSVVKYGLIKEGNTIIDFVSNMQNGVIDEGTIAGNDTLDYELRLWIDSSVVGITQVQSKFLSFKLSTDVSQEIKLSFVEQLANKAQESTSTFPNFKAISSETNGRGIYKYTEDGEDIYYWRGKVDEVEGAANHVLFANLCWEIVRTTKTGGLKIIYDGTPVEVDGVKTCPNTGTASQLASKSEFNSMINSPAYVGYMYGNTVYESKSKTLNDTVLNTAGILYGYDVEWNGTEYELKAKEEGGSLFSSTVSWYTDSTSVANGNHYTCFDSDGKCETVSYVYYAYRSYLYYIELSGGITIEKVLEQMYSNEQSSTIKTNIEDWFESTELLKEENLSKLEDVVYCNDRSVADMTTNGWIKDGNALNYMYYSLYTRRNGAPDLSCSGAENNRDRFTYKNVVTGNGLLKWPVGLLTADEIMLAGGVYGRSNSDFYLYTGQNYWVLSPCQFNYVNAFGFNVNSLGNLSGGVVNSAHGVRPVISLNSSVSFVDGGIGTVSNPYVVS